MTKTAANQRNFARTCRYEAMPERRANSLPLSDAHCAILDAHPDVLARSPRDVREEVAEWRRRQLREIAPPAPFIDMRDPAQSARMVGMWDDYHTREDDRRARPLLIAAVVAGLLLGGLLALMPIGDSPALDTRPTAFVSDV